MLGLGPVIKNSYLMDEAKGFAHEADHAVSQARATHGTDGIGDKSRRPSLRRVTCIQDFRICLGIYLCAICILTESKPINQANQPDGRRMRDSCFHGSQRQGS